MRAGEVPGRVCWPSVEGSPLLSPVDVAVIGVAALLLFGPDQLPKVARKAGSVLRDLQNTSQTFIREMEKAADIETPFSPSAWTGHEPDAPADKPGKSAEQPEAPIHDPVVHDRAEPRSAPEPFVHEPAAAAGDAPAPALAEPPAKNPAVKKPAARKAVRKPAAAKPAVPNPPADLAGADALPAVVPAIEGTLPSGPAAPKRVARKPAAREPQAGDEAPGPGFSL